VYGNVLDECRFMLPKSVHKICFENKGLEVTGKPNATKESKWVLSVVIESIQFLVEFKFLEESFTRRTCKVVNTGYVYV